MRNRRQCYWCFALLFGIPHVATALCASLTLLLRSNLLSHFALHNCRELEQQEVTHAAEIEALRRRLRSAQKRAQALRPASQPQVFSASNSASSGSSSSRHRSSDARAQRSDARRSSSSSGSDRRSREEAVSSSRQDSRQAAASSSNSGSEQGASDAAAAERERAWQEALRCMDLWGV
jgi:hypothetical protein